MDEKLAILTQTFWNDTYKRAGFVQIFHKGKWSGEKK